ncbi:uncharacterized protein At5g23160-like [Aristolochia californica]|uniref:uncharacterized protein At5g23160-like n=1 Tax=Aristolochia californica TaxID=171875 RepID=UPI0035E0248B
MGLRWANRIFNMYRPIRCISDRVKSNRYQLADDDDAEKGTRQRSSTVSCFGACFVDGKMKTWEESAGSQSRKKKKGGLLSLWRLIRRSKTMLGWKSQKTVPVDAAVVDVEEMEERISKLDPVVGMSILIIALAVLLWGRVCAVFCTSAWVYFISRLRKEARSGSRPDLGGQDMVSVESNKKVVMEGLVERSRRNPAEIL